MDWYKQLGVKGANLQSIEFCDNRWSTKCLQNENGFLWESAKQFMLEEIAIPMLTECYEESVELMDFCVPQKARNTIDTVFVPKGKRNVNSAYTKERKELTPSEKELFHEMFSVDQALFELTVDLFRHQIELMQEYI